MVFVEELVYYIGFRVLRDDFAMKVIGILFDNDGIVVEEFEKFIMEYFDKLRLLIEKKLFFVMFYCVFIFNNLIGFIFLIERCKKVIELFRKYNIFVFCDDVYNLLLYIDDRLFF